MHQVWPPEVGIGHLQLAAASSPPGHNIAFLIMKVHFQLEVFTALDGNLVMHQPCGRQEIREERRKDVTWVTQMRGP